LVCFAAAVVPNTSLDAARLGTGNIDRDGRCSATVGLARR